MLRQPAQHHYTPALSSEQMGVTAYQRDRELVLGHESQLRVVDYDFAALRGQIRADNLHAAEMDGKSGIEILRQLVSETREGWNRSMDRGAAVVDDSTNKLLDLTTRKGAIVSVLTTTEEEFVGYGLILTDEDHFPENDAAFPPEQKIPAELLVKIREEFSGPIFRGIRLFVKDQAREWGPFGTAPEKLMYHYFRMVGNGCIITNVQSEPLQYSYPQAVNLFSRVGYQFTEYKFPIQAKIKSGEEVEARRQWLVWPPFTEEGRIRRRAHEATLKLSEKSVLNRLAASVHLRGGNRPIVFESTDPAKDAWRLSHHLPGASILATTISHTADGLVHVKPGRISDTTTDSSGHVAPERSLGGMFLYETLGQVVLGSSRDPLSALTTYLQTKARELALGERLVLRQPIRPTYPFQDTFLDIRHDDGKIAGEDITEISTRVLFEKFIAIKGAMGFRNSGYFINPFEIDTTIAGPGFTRFRLPAALGAEFRLVMNQRDHFDQAARMPNTPYSRSEIENAGRSQGLRLLVSQTERLTDIGEKVWTDKAILRDSSGKLLSQPTNYEYVAEVVPSTHGVAMECVDTQMLDEPIFLSRKSFKRVLPGAGKVGDIFDLVERPYPTIEVLPWYELGGDIFVMGRDYARPIVTGASRALDEVHIGGYLFEPIADVLEASDDPQSQVQTILAQEAAIGEEAIRSIGHERLSFVSPGGANEVVRTRRVELTPRPPESEDDRVIAGIGQKGSPRAIEARRVLQGCQRGGNTDARLERSVYELLLERKHPLGRWLGDEIQIQSSDVQDIPIHPVSSALEIPSELTFAASDAAAGFMATLKGAYEERNASGERVGFVELEFAEPSPITNFTNNSVVTLPLLREESSGRYLVGLEKRDLPAVQQHLGSTSWIVTAPSFRLPESVPAEEDDTGALTFVKNTLPAHFRLEVSGFSKLGGKYFTSTGLLPEVAYPYIAHVRPETAKDANVTWAYLDELVLQTNRIYDGHLLTMIYRAAHALGVIE